MTDKGHQSDVGIPRGLQAWRPARFSPDQGDGLRNGFMGLRNQVQSPINELKQGAEISSVTVRII